MRFSCVATAAMWALAASWAMAADYSGSYTDGKLTVELKAAAAGAGGYAGSIKMAADAFPCKAQEKGGALAGTFEMKDASFDFSASLENKTLVLTTGQTTYRLARQAPAVANPLDVAPAPAPAPAPGPKNPLSGNAPADAPKKLPQGKIYKHPTGGTFGYPADWTVNATNQGLQLVPPNPGKNAQGPTEAYFIVAESAGGLKRADDPAAIAALEAYVAQQAPGLKRTGEAEKMNAGSQPGVALTWEVSANGQDVRARLYATILNGNAVFLLALGEKKQVMSREPALREVFATFGFGEAQIDKALAGAWHYWSYKGSNTGSGNISSEVRRTAELKEDGTFVISGNVESFISATVKDSGGDKTAYGSVAGQSGSAVKGKWSAGDGRLFLSFDSGSFVSFKYSFKDQGGNKWLLLDSGDGKPDEWSRNKL